MPVTNYINPASMAPNMNMMDQGPLGGMLFYDQLKDYKKAMEMQQMMQSIGVQRAQQEQQEFMGGAPLRQMQGQAQMETLGGQMPFLRQQAGSQAQTSIAQSDFQRNTQFGPEATADALRQLRQRATDDQWRNYGRELTAGAQLLNETIGIQQQQGDFPAQMHLRQGMSRLQQQGINLPEHFNNPQNWLPVLRATTSSLEHMRNIEMERVKGQEALKQGEQRGIVALNQTAMTGEAARDVAGTRAGGQASRESGIQQIARLRRTLAQDPQNQEAQVELSYALSSEFQRFAQRDTLLSILAARASSGDPEAIKAYDARYESEKKRFFANNGINAGKVIVKKVGPDGREMFSRIPKSQLQQALQQGYTEVTE